MRTGIPARLPQENIFLEEAEDFSAPLKAIRRACAPAPTTRPQARRPGPAAAREDFSSAKARLIWVLAICSEQPSATSGSQTPARGDELLNETLFRSLPHAGAVLENWRRDCSQHRPKRSSAGWRQRTTPAPYPESPATALRSLEAPRGRLLPPTTTKAQINPGPSLWVDEKRGHVSWAIEAKGAMSSRKGTRAFGAVSSEPRACKAVSKALLNAVFSSGIEPMKDTSLGIARPSDQHFDMWLDRIEPARSVLGIAIFRVSLNGQVTCSCENLPTRLTALQASKWPMPRSLKRNFKPLPPYE